VRVQALNAALHVAVPAQKLLVHFSLQLVQTTTLRVLLCGKGSAHRQRHHGRSARRDDEKLACSTHTHDTPNGMS
jgi:hypothetical protein